MMYKNMKRKIISIILIAVCMMSGFSAVYADNSRATFHNAKEDSPSLYVSKTVVNSDENYPAPEDTEFGFVLTLDGELADRADYRVFDQNGDEVFNYALPFDLIKIPFTTSRSGNFSLKAGQTAMFEYVGAGRSYEVAETDIPDKFIQTVPAGGAPVKGTVLPQGSTADFTNTYMPEDNRELTTLEVGKKITFPQGYELPETPEFIFTLKLDGKVYANEEYHVFDSVTGLNTGVIGRTDTGGSFRLKPDQMARFENIPANIDYEVSENKTEGWAAVGKDVRNGATQAPLTNITFTNRSASFGVYKKIADNAASADEFAFTLTDGERIGIAGAKYYLYNTNGERIDDGVYSTNAIGDFTLKADQAAVFFGLETGTVYNVSEKGSADYTQTVPVSNEGYTDKIIGEAFEMLPFVNTPLEIKSALTVTKTVSAGGGMMPVANADFEFILTRKAASVVEPVKNAVYSVTEGGKTATYKTDDGGGFTLKRNQTAVFEGLTAGETYQVEETNLSADYICKVPVYSGQLTDNLSFTFDNTYKGKQIDLFINKTDKDGEPLAGAKFDLYTDIEFNNKVNSQSMESGADGKITLEDITAGTYYLKETESPKGYRLLTDAIKLDITRSGKDLKVIINDEDSDKVSIIDINEGQDADDVVLKVTNYKGFQVPKVGGIGIHWFIIAAFVGIGAISIFARRRSRLRKTS